MASHARQQYFADEESIQKQSREFSLVDEIKDKIDSIEYWAQVNVIEEVQENWVPLEVVNKTVNVLVPEVIDNLYTIDPSNSLSAKQWKILYDLIQNLQSRGRYISNWNAATWLPITNPPESPYEYKAWDYYIVSNVASLGGTNYRPEPIEFIIWQASTTIEQETVKVTDMYLYDGSNWNLLINSTREIPIDSSLSTSSTNPVENRVVTNAINGKQDTLVAWNNIQIANDWKTISATDTTYTAGTNVSIDANNEISAVDTTYTAWANVNIDANNVISATDTVYWAWANIQISAQNIISATDTKYTAQDFDIKDLSDSTDKRTYRDNKQEKIIAWNNVTIGADWKTINATDTTYTAWTGIDITNWVISNTQTSAEWWNITWTLSNQTDLQSALDDKQDVLTAWDWIDIDANDNISVDVTDIIGTWLTEDANNNIIVDTTVVATQTDLSWKQDKATSGSTAPSTTPSYIWQQYIDTTNDKMYVATGTSSSSDWTEVGAWSWDMLYADFNWVTKTWATITLDLRSEITPSTDFTVNKPSTLEDWQYYILRVTSWATAYTMTLWTNVTNPYSEDLTLEASTVQQFTFLAKGWNLELQPSSEWVVYTAWTWITISNDEISVDSTVVALKSDLANYYTKTETYTKTEVDNLISSFWNFEVVASLPSVSTASENTIYLLGPIWTGADKYEEWIVTEETAPGHFESASTVDHDFVEIEWASGTIWNEDGAIQYKYIWINNINPASTPEWYFIQVDDRAGSNVEKSIYADTPMPFIWTDNVSQQIRWENPVVYGYTPWSFDIYYSDSELTWVEASTQKVWTKIWETSVDLSDLNTKTFYLSSTSDLTTATAALQWHFAGKNAIIVYRWYAYMIWTTGSSSPIVFISTIARSPSSSLTKNWIKNLQIFFDSSHNATVIHDSNKLNEQGFIETDYNYSTPYTPTYAGSPATKKYVDDNVVQKSATAPSSPTEWMVWYDTTNDVLKVYDGSNWNEVWSWIISSNNTYEDIVYLSQSDYDSLQNKDPNTLYSTPEGESWWFEPENEWEEWQFLVKTNTWYDWETVETGTWAVDHLEEMGLVWEKYTLSDTLFKQLTPALDDCTVEANVWDAAAEKEVHIQRQGSGTAANTLKLKVKKVGSPSNNLIVQVRKGIQVDVSSSEAYWYWDSENIIASGAITNSDITTSWQELEVTLDANFGGTEWELLDIVVMNWDSASVDASNYYVIACDSTQWSEGFSFVSVNWTTRTRSKLMPYCVSTGFVQTLLCKVSSAGVIGNNLTLYHKDKTDTGSAGKSYASWYTEIDKYTIKNWTTNITWIFYGKSPSSNYDVAYQIWSNDKVNITLSWRGGTVENTITDTKSVSVWDSVSIFFHNYASSSRAPGTGFIFYWVTIIWDWYIYKTSNINWIPRELKEIGNKVGITILWITIDNKWYDTNKETDEEKFIKSTIGWKLDFVKSKGTKHSITPQNNTNYTMVGYGYIRYSSRCTANRHIPYVAINNTTVCQCNNNDYSDCSVMEFLKPGDVVNYAYSDTLTNVELVDYY